MQPTTQPAPAAARTHSGFGEAGAPRTAAATDAACERSEDGGPQCALDTKVELLFEADELVIDRAARLRSCIERFHEAERGITAAAKNFDTARGALALWAGSARGHVPANVIKQAEYLASLDVITQIKVAMQEEENSRQQYQVVDGQREVVPSDYHADGAGAQ